MRRAGDPSVARRSAHPLPPGSTSRHTHSAVMAPSPPNSLPPPPPNPHVEEVVLEGYFMYTIRYRQTLHGRGCKLLCPPQTAEIRCTPLCIGEMQHRIGSKTCANPLKLTVGSTTGS